MKIKILFFNLPDVMKTVGRAKILHEALQVSWNFSSARCLQGTKIFQYCTCPAGRVTYNFHLSCKHMHLSFKSVYNKENKGAICNATSSSYSSQSTRPTRITSPF